MRLLRLVCMAIVAMATIAAADKNDEAPCKWSWAALGCTPKPGCKLQFKPRLFSLGPCVKVAPKEEAPPAKAPPTKAPPAEATPAEEAAPAEEEAAAADAPKEEP